MLYSFCSIINGGVLHQPTLLENFYDNENNVVYNNLNLINQRTREIASLFSFPRHLCIKNKTPDKNLLLILSLILVKLYTIKLSYD